MSGLEASESDKKTTGLLQVCVLNVSPPPQESTLHLVLRLRGGAKKRKKKSYTTPKKNKHKRKKVKLAVLKYYKVRTPESCRSSLNRPVFTVWSSSSCVEHSRQALVFGESIMMKFKLLKEFV